MDIENLITGAKNDIICMILRIKMAARAENITLCILSDALVSFTYENERDYRCTEL